MISFLDVVKLERRRYVQGVRVCACVEAKVKKEDDEKKKEKRQSGSRVEAK